MRVGGLIEGFLVLVAALATVASAAGFVWFFWLNDPGAPSAPEPEARAETPRAPPPSARAKDRAAPVPAQGRPQTASRYVVQADAPLLRLPDSTAEAKRTLRRGQTVERVGQIENWVLVRLAGPGDAATTGWVESRHVAPAN